MAYCLEVAEAHECVASSGAGVAVSSLTRGAIDGGEVSEWEGGGSRARANLELERVTAKNECVVFVIIQLLWLWCWRQSNVVAGLQFRV